ncbi:MAG TPA: hypothetical protein VEB59_16425 [Gemmatimonadales bacterium]|nr:hypothetical protein [Gemmatimonadales bacterium]
MPEQVRRAYDETLGAQDAGASTDVTAAFMLAFVAAFVIVSAIALMVALGAGPRHLGNRLAIAVAALFLLGWIASMAARLVRGREAVLDMESPGYRRFVVGCALASAGAAVLLFGVALYLPRGTP